MTASGKYDEWALHAYVDGEVAGESCAENTTTAPSSSSISATYTHLDGVRFYGDSSNLQAHDVYSIENLAITFDGEYFDGETGRGLGASHQTGWTALIAKLLTQNGE